MATRKNKSKSPAKQTRKRKVKRDPMPTLSELRVLIAFVEHGSFAEAGKATGTTGMNARARIVNLEKKTGERMFDKSRGGFEITDAAKDLVKKTKSAVERLVDAIGVGSVTTSADDGPDEDFDFDEE